MACAFLKVGIHKPCQFKPTKNSKYCKLHNYLIKPSKVLPCNNCGKGTYTKYRVCVNCGASKIRLRHRYICAVECQRLRDINIDYKTLCLNVQSFLLNDHSINTFLPRYITTLSDSVKSKTGLFPQTLEMINCASQAHRSSADFISKVDEIKMNKRITLYTIHSHEDTY